MLIFLIFEDVSLFNGNNTRVNVHRTRGSALMAYGAMVCDFLKIAEKSEIGRSESLGLIQSRFDQ